MRKEHKTNQELCVDCYCEMCGVELKEWEIVRCNACEAEVEYRTITARYERIRDEEVEW